jgi:chromosome partitioning protein
MSYVIAVANEKGGVAKTTTALTLGGALIQAQRDVLLIDLDPQANLSLSLGVNPNSLPQSISDVLLSNLELEQIIRETSVPGLYLAPASKDLGLAERFLSVREDYDLILRQAVRATPDFDMVLVDSPPALGPLTRSAVVSADLLIIPTQCEYFSAHALRDMLELIRNVRQRSNPRLRYRVLLTMLDLRNRVHNSLHDQIRQAFGKAVFDTAIQIDARLRESPIFKEPVTVYAPSSRSAQQYAALAQELRQYVNESSG